MSRIPSHIIDEIMNTARIEEVIGEYVQLKKSGSNYKGMSPFTEEKTPSFMVSPAKQIFKCFSTGKGGTAVSFLMELEQFSYPEALRWLADRYNIQLPEEKPLTPEEQQKLSERESLQIINTFARDFFANSIKNSTEGKNIGLSYFKERGFTEATIDKFQLGYCPRSEKSFTETAIEKGYKQEYLEQLGLTKTKNDRRFDFFSGRVMFPIHSVSGKVLGFGGRTLQTDKKVAKYFNSPESVLYDKSSVLYGINFAKNEIIKQDNCFLVEGYTDVISMSQSGVENVVSSSGTSLTKGQIKLIQRYTQNITVLYDSDPAGIKASFRGIDLLLEEGMTVKVCLFPEGEDPDSFAKSVGTDELKKYLADNQKDFVGFKTDILLEGTENDPIKRAGLIKEIVGSIALIPDSITRSVYIKQTASQFDFKEQTLLNEMNVIRRKALNNPRKSQTTPRKPQGGQRKPQVSNQPAPSPSPAPPNYEDEGDIPLEAFGEFPTPEVEKVDPNKRDFYDQEFDLIRILVLHGSRAIEIEKPEENQEGSNDVSVAELIIFELNRDELGFKNKLFQKIFELCRQGLDEDVFYEPARFLRHEDPEIVKFVSDILSPRYELSRQWLNTFNIETTEEIHRLAQAVKESLYAFKNAVIMMRIQDIQEELKNIDHNNTERLSELIKEQMSLEKIKSVFSSQLGRIIV
ncbi:DNA primase [Brumimicrobium aurantiacum]|uniref:DNA primase n=1 Tax=Brumimicrobium aurantiacum TaxID=1737063 RepID=A0A3E1EVI2_9FLAO|nr:DNA primase [Brumimicrobium aurantiacum]RFC53532.1 DNA primase [Brumimicrobium aurantiacum]